MNHRLSLIGIALCTLCSAHPVSATEPAYPDIVIDDVKHVITAPSHWDKAEWQQAGWVTLGIIGTAVILDRPLQDEMRRYAPNNNHFVSQVERLGAQYSIAVLGGFYLAGATGNQTAKHVAQDGFAASLIASGLITPSIKLVFGRSRPRANLGSTHFKPFTDSNTSFPSGHTTEAFALASVIANHYDERWVQYSAYSLAGLVGLARSYHDAHFASDILTGAIIGTLVGQSVVEHNRAMRNNSIAWLPEFIPGKIGVRIVKSF
ncbi:MAG: phosphatase PAP2 family protein [Gallionella sp.]|nr:phosphatase PAP2 family protein [Gallionella sp.]